MLEIVAGRIIAPYVGVSLYTWTSVIGVILAGLSLGNWLGGVWADRGAGHGAAGIVLAGAALASLAVLLLLTLVAPVVQRHALDLLSASFLLVLTLFFLPAVLLGVIAPLLTALALRLDPRSGHVVGRMHALAALGSILGTFAAGYWLVQHLGTRSVIVGCGLALGLLALPFLLQRRPLWLAGLSAASLPLALAIQSQGGFDDPCDSESQYFCIRVVDASARAPYGQARALVLDHLLHGINHAGDPTLLVAPYVHLMDELTSAHLGPRAATGRYFFAGGGAYTQPRALRARLPEARITVAELDPAVTDTAIARLYLRPAGMDIRHLDARIALARHRGPAFDAVVGDVFHDIVVPYHLVTRDHAELVRAQLAPGGIYVLNVVDAAGDPRLVKALLKTLREVFAHVHVWLESGAAAPDRRTYVLSAAHEDRLPAELAATRGPPRRWQRVTQALTAWGTPLERLPVLTDDYAPVERLASDLLLTPVGN